MATTDFGSEASESQKWSQEASDGRLLRSAAKAVDRNSADSTAGRICEPIACRWRNEGLEDAERPVGLALVLAVNAVADKYGEPAFRIRAQAQFLKDGDNRFWERGF